MIPRDYQTLLHEVLDGTATPEQVERLEAFLARSEEGRARRRELEGVFHALGRIPEAAPPADLRERVLATLRARARAVDHAPNRIRGARIRLAAVFAAGLLAGCVAMGAWTGVLSLSLPGGEPPVTGTMMPARPPSSDAVRRAWQVPGSRLDAVSWAVGDTRLVTLKVRGEEASEIELTFDPGLLAAGAVRQSRPGAGRVEVRPGRILLRPDDRGEYTVEFPEASSAAPIQITLRSGSAVAGGELPTAPAATP